MLYGICEKILLRNYFIPNSRARRKAEKCVSINKGLRFVSVFINLQPVHESFLLKPPRAHTK